MKNRIISFLSLPIALSVLLCSCSAKSADNAESNESASVSTSAAISSGNTDHDETSQSVTEIVKTETTTAVFDQSTESVSETTAADEDSMPQMPEIDEAAISSAKSQLEDNDIIVRKDTVRDHYHFPTRKCVLYVTSCGDYYASYYERENENDDSFWMNDIADTPRSIEEVEDAEYLGSLTDEELSELINFSLSVDPNAECYEHLRGEDEDAPAVYRPVYFIYTYMIWSEEHERTIYTAFVFDNLTYYLSSTDECASAAAMIINHGDIDNNYSKYYSERLDVY